MTEWLDHLRAGPGNTEHLAETFPWAGQMIGCPHDALYHAEGDPWTHTGMVADELERSDGFSDLPAERRAALRLGAWFHDVGKPATTEVAFCDKENRVRVRQPGHAPLGAKMAWQGLIDAGCDPRIARDVHALVFWHQRPHHMLGQTNTDARVLRFAAETRGIAWADLLRLCRADNLGRVAPNIQESIDELDMLALFIAEQGAPFGVDLLNGPWPYANEEARLAFLRSNNGVGSPHIVPPLPGGSRMILMSGLPGAGKNTAIAAHYPDLPVVELDSLREELQIAADGNQGRVLQAAFEAARGHFREGRDFVWNATCLSRLTRKKIVGLARDYGAVIEAVSVDVPLGVALARNARRENQVPPRVIEKLAAKREPVLADEAHQVWSLGADGELRPCLDRMVRASAPEEPTP